MKKGLIAVLVGAALCVTMGSTALAGGHTHSANEHTRSAGTSVRRYACNISGCNKTYNHKHYGVNYYGHTSADGHNHTWEH